MPSLTIPANIGTFSTRSKLDIYYILALATILQKPWPILRNDIDVTFHAIRS